MIHSLHQLFLQSTGICTDTRKIEKGSFFVCLKGPNFNANDFALKALELGAKYIVVDEARSEFESYPEKIYQVDNGLDFLQQLANYHRKRLDVQLIGLTGSNGKTTTKELLQVALSTKFNTWSTLGNFNNHIGLPLTILQATEKHEMMVLEMGDNALGDVELLCKIGEPDFGLITNIGKDHIGGFGSFENNVKAKLELFDHLSEAGKQFFILESDKELLVKLKSTQNVIQLPLLDFRISENGFVELQNKSNWIKTNLLGAYNAENISYAARIALYFDCDKDEVFEAIAAYLPKNNRSQIIKTTSNSILLDAYNANPSSVALVLQQFSEINSELPKAIVLGDMLELGNYSGEEHSSIVNLLNELKFGEVYLVGQEFKKASEQPSYLTFNSTEELKEYFTKKPLNKRHVLLKGSRKFKLEDLVSVL